MTTTNRPPRTTLDSRRVAYWQDIAAKRTRLAWATGILGGLIGFVLHAFISMPPVWM
ncbi:hypothetical protein [Corynebacterium minutissimum]|uniref:Uncharacterized protein n=1 Tax=Corynebacterium minutissimum TaxID=38301 RepID=A0A376CWE6_9CORY|nr:hypothetical protein [Corynebacterium minutissimum]QRP60570.1 hypothetical protein I6J26_10480 [Corynebacterium minutissimum]STC76346.1 Uncharacterised protein [Corynebacterium minutissimum]